MYEIGKDLIAFSVGLLLGPPLAYLILTIVLSVSRKDRQDG